MNASEKRVPNLRGSGVVTLAILLAVAVLWLGRAPQPSDRSTAGFGEGRAAGLQNARFSAGAARSFSRGIQ